MLCTQNPTLHQPLHSKVSNYLNDQRRTGQFCDLILELESGEEAISGHFCVIAAQSRFIGGSHFLQKSLQFSIHNPLKVTIKHFSCAECLQTLVDFFYEDVMSVAKEHEPHFRQLAKMLDVTELINLFDIKPEPIEAQVVEVPALPAMNATRPTLANAMIETMAPMDNADEQRNYFQLRNPRAVNASSKINYCLACDYKCYRVQDMITHMRNCEASHLTCSLCELGFLSWRDYDAHLRKHAIDLKKPFFCLECATRFCTRAALTIHKPKHTCEAPHKCPHCEKSFKWKQGLHNHLNIHSKEKHMLCDVCGYSTNHMKALKSHKLQHTGELFKCPEKGCNHRANRKENLKIHIETHKQERKFVCEVCGCKFSQSKNLKRHALKHSNDEQRKKKCQLCSFSSHRSDKVKEHTQRVHTEKAVHLELSEMLENSFETVEEYDMLTVVPAGAEKLKVQVVTKVSRQRKVKENVKKVQRDLRKILPKSKDAKQNEN